MKIEIVFCCFITLFLCSCKEPPLPVLGEIEIKDGDTIYHKIAHWNFLNQDSTSISEPSFRGLIYIVDFFFTSCPTICPKVKKNMKWLYDQTHQYPNVKYVSFTIDPERDHVLKLRQYAKDLNVSSDRWHFLTGNRDSIYSIADDYFSIATVDKDAPGGFDHSGKIILVDPNGRVRSFCDGTDSEACEQFLKDIERLMKE